MVVLVASTSFADWLARELADRDMNQSRLAAYLGVHPSGVNRWFTKAVVPNPATCARIAEILHVPVQTVLRVAGHLGDESAGGLPSAIPSVRAILDEMSEEEQRRFALPALRLAEQLLRESRGQGE